VSDEFLVAVFAALTLFNSKLKLKTLQKKTASPLPRTLGEKTGGPRTRDDDT
jgi:hypothetical protein